MRDQVIRSRNAAVVHHGRPARAGFTEVGPAAWPAIADSETWRAARVNAAARMTRFEADYEAGLIDGVRFAWLTAKAEADLADLDERIAASVQRSQSADVLAACDPGLAFSSPCSTSGGRCFAPCYGSQ